MADIKEKTTLEFASKTTSSFSRIINTKAAPTPIAAMTKTKSVTKAIPATLAPRSIPTKSKIEKERR